MNSIPLGNRLLVLALSIAIPAVSLAAPIAPVQNSEAVVEAPNLAKRGSLMRVPESAGYYVASMNHQAMIEAVTKSNAWKSIKTSDVARGMKKAYRRGRTRGYEDYNEENPFAQYLKGYGESIDNVIFQSVWQVAKQVIENELFIYADNDAVDLGIALTSAQADLIEQLGVGGLEDLDGDLDAQQSASIAELLRKHLVDMECPTVIIGSRLDNPDGFRGMLELARSLAEQGMRNLPPEAAFVQQWWKVIEEDNQFLLTVDINLSQLPWDDILDDVKDPVLLDAIRDSITNKRATVALGVVDNLLIVGIARNQQQLVSFGEGPRLVNMPELKKLRDAVDANETITSVVYMSDKVAKASYSLDKMYNNQKYLIGVFIQAIDEIPEANKAALTTLIENEIEEFITDAKAFQPEYGMQYGFTTLADNGVHGYLSQQCQPIVLDGTRSLDLAKHAGPNTLGFFAQRPTKTMEQYEFAAKWGSRLYGFAKQYGLPLVEEEMLDAVEEAAGDVAEQLERVTPLARQNQVELEKTEQALDDFNRELTGDKAETAKPTAEAVDKLADNKIESPDLDQPTPEATNDGVANLEKFKSLIGDFETFAVNFDKITRDTFLPSIADNESALFVDMISGPDSWHPDIPKSPSPLPIPMPALIVGTNDSAKTVKASEDYWRIIETFFNKAKSYADDDEAKNSELIAPERLVTDEGTAFRWSLLSDFGKFDSSLRMGSLISDDWMVINAHPEQAQQLTGKRDSNLFGPAVSTEPSYTLAFYDHRVAMNGVHKWFDFAEAEARKDGEDLFDMSKYVAERDTLQFTEPQLRDWLNRIWAMGECWKGFSLRSFAEGETTVTEYVLKFEDVPAP